MSEEILDSGLYIAMSGLSVEAIRTLALWHRSHAAQLHARPQLDDRDVMAATFELRLSKALTSYADALEAGRALRLQSKFEAVFTQAGIDLDHEPEDGE
jgi:hypothetical protein